MSGTYSPEQRLYQAVILQALIDVAGLAKRVESKLKPELLREIEKESADWFRYRRSADLAIIIITPGCNK
jgi:hypothetical protein